MEDCIAIHKAANRLYLGVFDGHGGQEAAEYASKELWDIICAQLEHETSDFKPALQKAFQIIHEQMMTIRTSKKSS